jgi:bifunctional DNA-binding transcriptional regulator/antitoxin component of YhaV-PrlF toxin-antitoxin module
VKPHTTKQLIIPDQFRKALHLEPGDKVSLTLEGEKLVLQRDEPRRATLIEENGRKVLVAPADAPPMTTESIKALLVDFP